MTPQDILLYRLHNQHLSGAPSTDPIAAVRLLGAVQSQDFPGAKWAVAQRSAGHPTDLDITKLYNEGHILRTHIMRPTWHFVLPQDIRWLQEVTAPRVRSLMAYYDRKLGIDEAFRTRAVKCIAAALRGTTLTRAELSAALQEAGIAAKGQLLAHTVMHAELDAVICSGPMRGKQFTYALLADRAPQAISPPRPQALTELARRYFTAHGPATIQDFAWWSGLSAADARQAAQLAGAALASTTVAGKLYWHAATLPSHPLALPLPFVRLLPNYDEYIVAYKDHQLVAHPAITVTDVIRSDALSAHFVVVNGRIVGGWRREVTKQGFLLRGQMLVKLTADERMALSQQVRQYSQFVGVPVQWSEAPRPDHAA